MYSCSWAIGLYFLNYRATGEYTFNLLEYYRLELSFAVQFWLFLAFAFAFAIKVPHVPPSTHGCRTPTWSAYGGKRNPGWRPAKDGNLWFCAILPAVVSGGKPRLYTGNIVDGHYGHCLWGIGFYGTGRLKKLVAYSSVSHLGFVMLGVFAFNVQGIEGGIIQMVNHGISTGALFLVVGMLYERRHTRLIADFGGLTKQMPVFATLFLIVTLSSIGLPGLNGFVGNSLSLLAPLKSNVLYASIATSGIILAPSTCCGCFNGSCFRKSPMRKIRR